MRLLLDSHVLSVVSVASVWELEMKRVKGTLDVPADTGARLNPAGFDLLDVTLTHVVRAAELPSHHRDPFDRMLVAQAQAEGLTLVTADAALDAYDVPIMSARV
ncbi:MAG TPA: type II toxin-antitoxin system VapC family toxin [Conexibacter sp.]|nr:type II toxin-antitoxin system VapC family toxin [Conexibacter sp.]